MKPDAGMLRSASRALLEQAGAAEAARVAVSAKLSDTTWEAVAATRQQVELAGLDAQARTGVDELRVGGHHLRRFAEAIEILEDAMRAAHRAREVGLQAELRQLANDPAMAGQVSALHRELYLLPPPDDSYWSTQVSVPSVAAPVAAVSSSTAALGPYVPPLVVRVDIAEVRALASSLSQQAMTVGDVRGRAGEAVALPLSQLDAYGLPGSRAAGFLADAISPAGELAHVAAGWPEAAMRARALASLVEYADDAGLLSEVLKDSRVETALDLSVLLASTSGDEQVGRALLSLSDADAEWAMEHVPGLHERVAQSFPTLEAVDLLNGLVLAPGEAGRIAFGRGSQAGQDAKALKALRNQGTPEQRAALRAQRNALLREMRAARASGARYAAVTARVPPGVTTLLNRVNAPLLRSVPVLRNVPLLAVALTGFGIYDDVHNRGMSVPLATVKNVGSTAAGLATTVLVTGLVAATVVGSVALAPIIIGIAAGAIVGYGVGQAIEHYDDIAEWGGDRLEDVGGAWNSVFG